MPKSNIKGKKTQRAVEATSKDAAPPAEKSSPKVTTAQPVAEATTMDSASRVKKASPKKKQASATAPAPSAKPTRRTRVSKRKDVRLTAPYEEHATTESDTDTPNPDLITGDEDPTPGPTAPRATKPKDGELVSANTTASEPAPVEEAPIPSPEEPSNDRKADDFLNSSGTHGPKGYANATPPAKAPPGAVAASRGWSRPGGLRGVRAGSGPRARRGPQTPPRRRSSLSNNG
ncbi:unnamed protein product [Phytophthora fragariaefolia]|uniref:Unnamed protein product n=1 Tax=Phytophthora fragariaefolia TaxID=1490495 RepID=A0A9W6U5J7_9STRA|nr:unnamed protein product [Phytophthora fragariaefolia]